MHSQYVGVCNDLPSKNLFKNKITIIKKMLLKLTMVGYCSQDNIIYKCRPNKLHDHSSNRE